MQTTFPLSITFPNATFFYLATFLRLFFTFYWIRYHSCKVLRLEVTQRSLSLFRFIHSTIFLICSTTATCTIILLILIKWAMFENGNFSPHFIGLHEDVFKYVKFCWVLCNSDFGTSNVTLASYITIYFWPRIWKLYLQYC